MKRIGEIDEKGRNREIRKKQIELFLRMFERQEVVAELDAGPFVVMVGQKVVNEQRMEEN